MDPLNASSQTQISAATALAQLLTEHPELPLLHWTVAPSGWWSGALHTKDVDVRAVMAQFVAVVGGEPHEMWSPKDDDHEFERFGTICNARWRDVDLYLSMSCNAALVAETAQVSA